MFSSIRYVNDTLTLIETGFNILGYLPRSRFPVLYQISSKWRNHLGKGQLIVGIALMALGYLAHYTLPMLAKSSYFSLPMQVVALGLLYANHGLFNLIRNAIEKQNIPGLTLVYDFYNKKVLPALSPRCDILRIFFEYIKKLLDSIRFVTLIPFEIAKL